MKLFCGIDIGSSEIKIVIVNEQTELVAYCSAPTGARLNQNTHDALLNCLTRNQLDLKSISYTVATGYGRKLYRNSNEQISEITANAVGVRKMMKDFDSGSIINIGGQDSKIIKTDKEGNVVNFLMNDKCAAGTGRFLEMAAKNLEVDIEDLGKIHSEFQGIPKKINSTCTVFAESEIISLLANGSSKEEIITGVHHSIAKRISRMATRIGIDDKVVFDGGTALNDGMTLALKHELATEILVPELPQFTTAFGAASLAKDYY